MDRAFQLFAVCLLLILVTAGLTYRWTNNAAELKIKVLETKFNNLQSVIESKATSTQSELGNLRRDLEANTEAIRSTFGNQFAQLQKQVESTQSQSSLDLSSALTDILGRLKEVQDKSKVVEQKVATVAADNGDFSVVVDKSMPAVLSIQAGQTIGSGFLISAEGLAVTNYHVVKHSSDIKAITSDKVNYRATLLAYDEVADLALLRMTTPRVDFPFLEFGDSSQIDVGEPVVAIGSPGGYKFSVSKGILSAKERKGDSGVELFQMDVAINPGNSGGPVINRNGKVMAIAVGFRELEIMGLDRVGFAIQGNYAKQKIDEFKQKVFSSI